MSRSASSIDEGGVRNQRRSLLIAASVYPLLGVVLLHEAFANFDHYGGKDWNGFVGQAARLVPGLVFFGCSLFPLYLVGGIP